MSNEIRKQVESILSQAGVTASVSYRGERKTALGGQQTMDEWLFAFATAGNAKLEEFEFFTGLGLRGPAPKPMDGGPKPRPGTLMHEKLEKQRKPVKPHAADVLHGLILDSSALEMSFDGWCSEYGYDNDSRKADGTFHACRDNARKLDRIIPGAALADLREALQDY